MYDEEFTNVDDNSEPSNACSDLVPSPSVLILYPLFKHDIKEAPNSANKCRNKQKLNHSLASDNLSDQDGDIMLPNAYFDPNSHPVPPVFDFGSVMGMAPLTLLVWCTKAGGTGRELGSKYALGSMISQSLRSRW